ncbi:MAG: hypothetical protein DRJ01_11870 [Bacteroidetes bacterium]|nr:MAG: hypothetical protein DRJ01_11870 [Bacteroidota bacterium]
MKLLRQNSGIDMAKDTFVAGFTTINKEQIVLQKRPKTFNNNLAGYIGFLNWIGKFQSNDIQMNFTMEATGVYYEGLAYFLHERNKCYYSLKGYHYYSSKVYQLN